MKKKSTEYIFSIITPTYNCGSKLQRTLQSVQSQGADIYEHLVIDGSSTDNTIAVVKGFLDARPRKELRWISEPDHGIYDAMNKGIAIANGKFLLFLGAGDCLRPNILEQIANAMPDNLLSLTYGNVSMPDYKIYDGYFDNAKIAGMNICHQSIFYGRDVFKHVGLFETKYRLLADHSFNIKCFGNKRIQKKYLDIVITNYEGGGVSNQSKDVKFAQDHVFLAIRYLGLKVAWRSVIAHRIHNCKVSYLQRGKSFFTKHP